MSINESSSFQLPEITNPSVKYKAEKDKDDGHVHFGATCYYCNKSEWQCRKPFIIEAHFALHCKKVNDNIDAESPIRKKNKMTNQSITLHYQTVNKLTFQQSVNITKALLKAFVCYTLSGPMLDSEIARVVVKIDAELQRTDNLTLSLNGWTSSKDNSVYNYIITTPSHCKYLYAIEDYSGYRQTGNFIANKILDIIEKISSHRFAAVITDSGSNICIVQQSINHNYSPILSVHCIAHALNLLSANLVKNISIKEFLKQANMLVSFIQKSHLASWVLQDTISSMNIRDGSLETYCKTCWTSIYDTANFIIHVKPAIDKWGVIEDEYTHLQKLAKTMFAIIPFQASCEQNFSILKWFSEEHYTWLQ
ncbi:14605_t:CDS:2, partial [Gigaspora margarita]